MPGGHPVAQVERPQHRAEQSNLEAGQLLGALLEILGALLRLEQLVEQLLEAQEQGAEHGERDEAVVQLDLGDADGQDGRDHVRDQQRHERLARGIDDRVALDVAPVGRDHQEVHEQRRHEQREDERGEGRVGRCQPGAVLDRVGRESAGQRERGVDRQVREQEVRLDAPLERAGDDRRDTNQRGRGATEQHHRDDDREEAARHLQVRRADAGRHQVAGDRERRQQAEDLEVPVRVRCGERGDGDPRREQRAVENQDGSGGLTHLPGSSPVLFRLLLQELEPCTRRGEPHTARPFAYIGLTQ